MKTRPLTKAQIKELDDCIELINKDYGKTEKLPEAFTTFVSECAL